MLFWLIWFCCENCRPMDNDVGGRGSKRAMTCTMVGLDTREVGENNEVSVVFR